MRRVRRLLLVVGLLAALGTVVSPVSPALAAGPRTTLNDVEDELMCVVCGVPLNIAESPQADRERVLINQLIDQGKTKEQIKAAMVAEYGEQVLADPHGGGFNVTAWLVPLLVVAFLLGSVAVLVPRWRRRQITAELAGEEPAAAADAVPELDADARRRLDEDLARYR
jgi:cytochrome c-type biogenesis protein CcmH